MRVADTTEVSGGVTADSIKHGLYAKNQSSLRRIGGLKTMKKKVSACFVTLTMLTVLPALYADDQEGRDKEKEKFAVTSTTFSNNGTLPLSMVASAMIGCPSNGGNQSPKLSWTHAPSHTESFVVVMFDETAAFTHWGMYNISAKTSTSFPQVLGWLEAALAPKW